MAMVQFVMSSNIHSHENLFIFRENCIHICTEYMDGGSLDQYGALPEAVIRPVAVSMIQGLFSYCKWNFA